MCTQSLSRVQLFETLWTKAYQAPLSMGFPRKEHWLEWVAVPSPGDFPNPGIEAVCSALAGRFFTSEPPGKPIHFTWKRATQDVLISTWYSNGFKTHFAHLIRIIYEWLVAIILLIVDSNNKSARANSYLRHEGRFFCNSVKMSAYCSCVCRMLLTYS